MDPEEYIQTYGANLTESEKNYIRAFGAPTVAAPGPSRRAYTPNLRIADAREHERTSDVQDYFGTSDR